MASMYAKVFTQIFDSSLADDWQTRHVFEDLLKLCDLNGVVDMTPDSIARRTNIPLDVITRAISNLESPDPKSRTPANEGRRLVRLDGHREWGWIIVNFDHYRKLTSEEQRREKTLERVKNFRNKTPVTPRNAVKRSVTPVNASNAMQKQKQKQKQIQSTDKDIQPPAVSGEHNAFIKGWSENYEAVHKVKYQFEGGRDGRAVRELLRMGILRLDLLEIAKKAWVMKGNAFLAGQSLTIHGFRNNFNAIQTGVKNGTHLTNGKPNPRNLNSNAGHASDYSQVGKTTHMGIQNAEPEP